MLSVHAVVKHFEQERRRPIPAFIGGALFGYLMPGATVGLIGSILVAFVGAVILLAVLRAVSTRRRFGWR